MEIINQYFKNLLFTKVVENKEGYAIYGAGISSGIGGGKMRYVLLFVPVSEAKLHQGKITELRWKNLQTRTLEDSYKLKTQRWIMPSNIPDYLIFIKNRNAKCSTYTIPDIPFEILLLHNPRKKTEYQYRNKMTLSAAIDMFETIINYKEPEISYPFIPPVTHIPANYFHSSHHFDRHEITSPEDHSFELL